MAFTCNICGFRNSEVKGGGAIPTMGTRIALTVLDPEDFKRYYPSFPPYPTDRQSGYLADCRLNDG